MFVGLSLVATRAVPSEGGSRRDTASPLRMRVEGPRNHGVQSDAHEFSTDQKLMHPTRSISVDIAAVLAAGKLAGHLRFVSPARRHDSLGAVCVAQLRESE